ncbi:hypothetical protein SEVIR_8G085800v4 [Setaria viridis]|uniref:Uncharacterized protein n=1 Tax=Setaria viridis TaxID=4556 RepID=A0A4U6TGB1_SETVI|nr:hypothetical protein SEVIR_8G085800v2 [Setaria viridis]
MDGNSQPPAPPAATMITLANPFMRPAAAVTTVPWLPTAVHQQRQPKLPVFRPPAAATVTPERQLLQGSSSQQVPAAAPPVAATAPRGPTVLGVSRPPAPPTAMMANPSPRFMQVNNRLTLRDLQLLPKLPVYRGPTPRPELARSVSSGNPLLQSSVDTGPCALNMQADLPSPDELSERDSGSEDELEMLD